MPSPEAARLRTEHPKAYVGVYLVAGALMTGILVWGFATIADAIGEHGRVVQGDAALTAWIQRHDTEWGESLFSAISWLGAPVLVAFLAIAAGWCGVRRRDWASALTIALTAASGAALNTLLKHLFHRGRPEYAAEFIVHQSWSFPSGHAMDSLVGYGILLVVTLPLVRSGPRRALVIVGVSILVLLIGISRVYLGVHYLSDVLAGWLAGGAWLLVCATAAKAARQSISRPAENGSHPVR